jgi:hypothetical protein
MYLRMGFVEIGEAPDILGVPYAVYVKRLDEACTDKGPDAWFWVQAEIRLLDQRFAGFDAREHQYHRAHHRYWHAPPQAGRPDT